MLKKTVIISTNALNPPLTGIGRYTLELAYGCAKSTDLQDVLYDNGWAWLPKKSLEYIYEQQSQVPIHTQSAIAAQKQQKQQKSENPHLLQQFKKIFGLAKRSSLARTIYRRLNAYWQNQHLKQLNASADAIYHGTNFYIPEKFAGARIVTIHDLSIFKYPEHHPKPRVEMMHKAVLHSLKHANHIITLTEHIKQEIADYFAYPLHKITAIHLAANSRYQKIDADDVFLKSFLHQHQLSYKKYTLCVATIEPRKNIEALIEAYLALPLALRLAHPLVLAGGYGWESDDLHQKIQKYQAQGWLKYLAYLPEFDLPYLFNAAKIFAFPSVYEGFGLPVLEAMQCGVPVLIGKNTALEEVAGFAGIAIEPLDVAGWSQEISKLLRDDVLCQKLQAASLLRAKKFSWQQTVAQTINIYKNI